MEQGDLQRDETRAELEDEYLKPRLVHCLVEKEAMILISDLLVEPPGIAHARATSHLLLEVGPRRSGGIGEGGLYRSTTLHPSVCSAMKSESESGDKRY